jgi:putative aldouronate transport system permease protein
MGMFLSADLNQVINMQNDVNLRTIDILDTYVYRIGLQTGEYALATAAGLFKAVIGIMLIIGVALRQQAAHGQGSVVMAQRKLIRLGLLAEPPSPARGEVEMAC